MLPGQKGTVSLQCHLAERAQPGNQPAGPVINFNIPPELLTAFCPPDDNIHPSRSTPIIAAAPHSEGETPQDSLIPHGVQYGPTLSLHQFCHDYNLSDNILAKLSDNGYTGTETVCYVLISELKEMGFKLGEIAAMRAAMKHWCK